MSRRWCSVSMFMLMLGFVWPIVAEAQLLGTFRWQLQSYCNIVSLVVTQNGSVYTLDGFDDQCGAATRAPVTGTATPNPDGTVEFGFNIIVTPGGAPVHVAAVINVATLGGTWRDHTGGSGTFVFTPGAGTGGSPRPNPNTTPAIPTAFALLSDGGFLAEGTLGTGNIPDSGPGTKMMWYPNKAAFRAGHVEIPLWDDVKIGQYSAAFGKNTAAVGAYSFAFGGDTSALGTASVAGGASSNAGADMSVAIGLNVHANAVSSVAFGVNTVANGVASFVAGSGSSAGGAAAMAFGSSVQANGSNSFAMGNQVSTSGATSVALGYHAVAAGNGSFSFADRSSTANFTAFDNQFAVRAIGGSGFYTKADNTAGVELAPNASAWSSVSDANMKENFRDLPGEDLLSKIAQMPVREWNYKAQGASIRHMGPTAQDFYDAFGLGENRLRISTIDADGVALAAARALEARTRTNDEALAHENDVLKAEIGALRERLEQLERLLIEKR
jgi:hypothetical protein